MGLLVDGVWLDQWYDTKSTGGRFVRGKAAFRNWITPDGTPGPSGVGGFKAEPGRYRPYVSLACPWAHRTLVFRKLKRLEHIISCGFASVVRKSGLAERMLRTSEPLHEQPILASGPLILTFAKQSAKMGCEC
jgi:glutathionyl-hydroquinone reductase